MSYLFKYSGLRMDGSWKWEATRDRGLRISRKASHFQLTLPQPQTQTTPQNAQ